MGFDDDGSGTCLYVHRDVVVCRRAFLGKARRRRVLGPVGTGPRLERRSLYKDLGSFPLHRLFVSKRTTPERGQMLRRAVCQTASNVYQPRPASPDRGHGVRRGARVRRSEFAVLLRFTCN